MFVTLLRGAERALLSERSSVNTRGSLFTAETYGSVKVIAVCAKTYIAVARSTLELKSGKCDDRTSIERSKDVIYQRKIWAPKLAYIPKGNFGRIVQAKDKDVGAMRLCGTTEGQIPSAGLWGGYVVGRNCLSRHLAVAVPRFVGLHRKHGRVKRLRLHIDAFWIVGL